MNLNQNARIISTYSADTFGVCSALFELGGMIVMHDPSGCNSTYTTHDEPRWYDFDSLIFISALTEQDAVLGLDEKFIEDVVASALQFKPQFICIIPSQITFLIGTDMVALAKIIERKTSITCFTLPTNSMHYYERGIYYALEWLADYAVKHHREKNFTTDEPKVNILGLTPLDFGAKNTIPALKKFLTDANLYPLSCWAMGETLASIVNSTHATVNLVVSYGGLGAARIMEKELGTPYVVGVPLGSMQSKISSALKKSAKDRKSRISYLSAEPLDILPGAMTAGTSDNPCHAEYISSICPVDIILIGESILAETLSKAITTATNHSVQVIAPVETEKALLSANTLQLTDEKDLLKVFAKAKLIIADPLYKPLLNYMAVPVPKFIDLPHEGFSGRLYAKNILNLIDPATFNQFIERLSNAY